MWFIHSKTKGSCSSLRCLLNCASIASGIPKLAKNMYTRPIDAANDSGKAFPFKKSLALSLAFLRLLMAIV